MIYSFQKYSNITSFLNPGEVSDVNKEFSIPMASECKGIKSNSQSEINFTPKCFKCNFCAFGELEEDYKRFINFPIDDSNYFNGELVDLPSASKLNNPTCSLETFTEKNERSRIQKWEMGILKNILGENYKISEEIMAPSNDDDRAGRIDIGVYNKNDEIILLETKTTLNDTLNDERFVAQFEKYHNSINASNFDGEYLLCLSIGGYEQELLPPGLSETADVGNKRARLYNLLNNKSKRIPMISANAIWCLSTMYINNNIDDIAKKLIQIFKDESNIALLSCGVIRFDKDNEKYEILPLYKIKVWI